MLLQALVALYEQLLAEGEEEKQVYGPGWSPVPISYAVSIDENGKLVSILPLLADAVSGKKHKLEPQRMRLPADVNRRNTIASNFLWEEPSYMLGVRSKGKQDRSEAAFAACKQLHLQLLSGIDTKAARGIVSFFNSWDASQIDSNPVLEPYMEEFAKGPKMVFLVDGTYPQEDGAICTAWQRYYDDMDGPRMQCMVTGEVSVVERTHPVIKGVPGTTQPTLISFKEPAFCSYGLKQSLNAPVSRYAAFAYTTALNYLLDSPDNHRKIGDMTLVCWAEGQDPDGNIVLSFVDGEPFPVGLKESDVVTVLNQVAYGLPCNLIDAGSIRDRHFYVLGLTPNNGRIAIQFFFRDTFGKLAANLNTHYERLKIVPDGTARHVPFVKDIIMEAIERKERNGDKKSGKDDAEKNMPNRLLTDLLRTIIFRSNYPQALLSMIHTRIERDGIINQYRAAIIKADMIQRGVIKEGTMESFDENCRDIPYVLGALFAVYERVQKLANPNVNMTIYNRYYSLAQNRPNVAFRQLDKLAAVHLRQVMRRDARQAAMLQNTIKKLWMQIPAEDPPIPHRFTEDEKNMFILGYYHRTNWVKDTAEKTKGETINE